MTNIFEKLDKFDVEVRKEKSKRKYRLWIYNSLFTDGHIAKMGDPTLTWLVLGDKCTGTAIFNGKVLGYLVYGGQYSDKIIDELVKIRGKSKSAIWRDLEHLKKTKRIDYQTRRGVGTRIIVYPIPGAFERQFKTVKSIGHKERNVTKKLTKRCLVSNKMLLSKSHNVTYEKSPKKELPKENKDNSENGKNRKVLDNDLYKDNSNNKDLLAVASQIARILKGTITKEKVLAEIQGGEQEKMLGLAREVIERSGVENPAGLFITLAREEKAKGQEQGQASATGVFAYIPDEVLGIVKEKFQGKELENQLWQTLDRYHERFNPREFHKCKEDLSESEIRDMVEITKRSAKSKD